MKLKKIAFISLLAICFVAPLLSPAITASASEGELLISPNPMSQPAGERIVERALTLEELHKERGSGTKEEAEMAETLAGMLEEYGFNEMYDGYIDEFRYMPLVDTSNTTSVTNQNKTSQNVIGGINNNSEQTIIIGAHYDNYEREKETGGTGFYDNLLGVATAFEVAYQLSLEENLDYNILLAFWGAEEDGIHGSEYFVSSLKSDELSKIALYVNFDTLGVGDNLYIFTNEIPELHEEAFMNSSKLLGYDLLPSPNEKHYTMATLEERPFMHLGIQTDNFYFVTNGVPSVNFVSYNWGLEGFSESVNHKNLQHTKNDNSEYIFSVHTREVIEQNMTEVADIVISTLQNDDIIHVLEESKNKSQVSEIRYDGSFSVIVTICILAVFAIVIFVQMKKLDKEIKAPEQEVAPRHVKVEKIEVFGETVTLEDGVRKRDNKDPNSVLHSRSQIDKNNNNPFDF